MEGGPGPKRSRLFAAVVLVGAAGLLCLPEGREAVRTVRAVWEDFGQGELDQTQLEALAKRAEKENDAQMMAFVALNTESGKERATLAERAVSIDPQLTWIYAAAAHGSLNETVNADWLARAEAADPDNAVPYLLAADTVTKLHLASAGDQRAPTAPEISDRLAANAEWRALMAKAFHAPRYDSYYRRHRELNREVWERKPELPFTYALEGLWMHGVPNLFYLRAFAEFLVQQSERERAAGHLEEAQQLLREVDGFGAQMQHGDSMDLEKWMGIALQQEAAEGWKSFYQATGKMAEAQVVAQRLAETEKRRREDALAGKRLWEERSRGRVDAWAVQLSAIVVGLATVLAISSIGVFEMRPAIGRGETTLRRILGWTADFAPATVLAACGLLLVSFLPYARLFAAFRAGGVGAPDERQMIASFWSLLGVTYSIGGPDAAVLGWTALTVVLSLVAALILARMAYRAMRRTAPQV